MNQTFKGWVDVAQDLCKRADDNSLKDSYLNEGQRASLRAIAKKIVKNGVLIADEVGMGKTRIAVEVARAVKEAGGRVAILAPPGLGYQWREQLKIGNIEPEKEILRSIYSFLEVWQDETEQLPWFEHKVVLLSHAFSTWRMGDKTSDWRFALLPEVHAHWQKLRKGRLPRDYRGNDALWYNRTNNAANSITSAIKWNSRGWRKLNELSRYFSGDWKWLLQPSAYSKGSEIREWFDTVVGLGLGSFDLIIVDEAHKNRRKESGLDTLLNKVIWKADSARHLALTATPIELGVSQWTDTLKRLGLAEEVLENIQGVCNDYEKAVLDVRDAHTCSRTRASFEKAATSLKEQLSPYLIRRDKREDPIVKKFRDHSKQSHHEYRKAIPIHVEAKDQKDNWRVAICAAEALSVVARQATVPEAKRLRLTFASGHGLTKLLDTHITEEDASEDAHQEMDDHEAAKERGEYSNDGGDGGAENGKRAKRAEWWSGVLRHAFQQAGNSLYHHPAILKAIEVVEKETVRGEKVLVFGKLTKPMQAFVALLNAREMLRRLHNDEEWPQSVYDNWPVVAVAAKQLKAELTEGQFSFPFSDLASLNIELARRYESRSRDRAHFREGLIPAIEAYFNAGPVYPMEDRGNPRVMPSQQARFFFDAFKKSVSAGKGSASDGLLALMTRALLETVDHNNQVSRLAEGFEPLIKTVLDRDSFEQEEIDEENVGVTWLEFRRRLEEEFPTTRGGFARLMNGETSHHSRRMIQLAFNRRHSFPKVLVAQSLVGREGLNLHEACRIVLLLHPEWNPGVVEQQIGRVDRLGSHWEKELERAIEQKKQGDEVPRIEIRSIIFSGTYDEHNWKVLNSRWDTLRSQLHGVVIPEDKAGNDEDLKKLIQEINSAAPDFSP